MLAIPLDGKRFDDPDPKRGYGIVWVLESSADCAVIATTAWVGTEQEVVRGTALQDPRTREITSRWRLRKNTIAWRIGSPDGSALVGIVAPPQERAQSCKRGDWDKIRAVLAAAAPTALASRAATSRRKPSIARLRRTVWFTSWRGRVPQAAIVAARQLVRDALDALAALAAHAPRPRAVAILKKAMRAFNALDRQRRFVTSIEAEDITLALAGVASAAGIDRDAFDREIDVLRLF